MIEECRTKADLPKATVEVSILLTDHNMSEGVSKIPLSRSLPPFCLLCVDFISTRVSYRSVTSVRIASHVDDRAGGGLGEAWTTRDD